MTCAKQYYNHAVDNMPTRSIKTFANEQDLDAQ